MFVYGLVHVCGIVLWSGVSTLLVVGVLGGFDRLGARPLIVNIILTQHTFKSCVLGL